MWVEEIAGEEGARVLNVNEALLQPFSRDALCLEHLGMKVGAFEGGVGFQKGFDGGTESIWPEIDVGWSVVPDAEAFRGRFSERTNPTFGEEVWVREADPDGVAIDGPGEFISVSGCASKDRVDEPPCSSGERNGFKNGCVRRDASVQDLVEPEA